MPPNASPLSSPRVSVSFARLGASMEAPYDSALTPTTAKTLWIGFGDLCGHAKPCFDCEGQFKRIKGRASHSLPLTRLNWQRFDPCEAACRARSRPKSAACLEGVRQAIPQSISALRAAWLSPKRVPDKRTLGSREYAQQGVACPQFSPSPR